MVNTVNGRCCSCGPTETCCVHRKAFWSICRCRLWRSSGRARRTFRRSDLSVGFIIINLSTRHVRYVHSQNLFRSRDCIREQISRQTSQNVIPDSPVPGACLRKKERKEATTAQVLQTIVSLLPIPRPTTKTQETHSSIAPTNGQKCLQYRICPRFDNR